MMSGTNLEFKIPDTPQSWVDRLMCGLRDRSWWHQYYGMETRIAEVFEECRRATR